MLRFTDSLFAQPLALAGFNIFAGLRKRRDPGPDVRQSRTMAELRSRGAESVLAD